MSDLRGKYRNKLGAELEVTEPASTTFNTLGGDIFIARVLRDFFGPMEYLVTKESLEASGYARIED